MSALRIVHLVPTLLGTYGDRGNALVLAHRARLRGLGAEVVTVDPGEPVPRDGDVYLLGGGEDLAQTAAVDLLRRDGGLQAAVDGGATVLAVCAGLQLLGHRFAAGGTMVDGLGLLDLETVAGRPRAVGEVLVDAGPLGLVTGFENHGGRTALGPHAAPLGRVLVGTGNGDGRDGAVQGRIVATYLHGPVLARNPALADHVLSLALGTALEPLADPFADALRAERLRHVSGRRRPRRSA